VNPQPAPPRVLYLCARLPSNIQNGLDLRIRGQMMALLEFCELSVFALNGKGQRFDERIGPWRSSENTDVAKTIDTNVGMTALRDGGHPFAPRFSEETAKEISEEIRSFRPSHIILSRIDLTVYLEIIKQQFDGVLILDLDESAASTGPSIQKLLKNPGQALIFRTFSERVKEIEQAVFADFDQVWVSSEIEHERVTVIAQDKLRKNPILSIVPNCIPVDAYSSSRGIRRRTDTIIYPASFAYEPSVDAARFLIHELMPLLPELKLKLLGSHITAWMREVSSASIFLEGPIADMIPHLKEASALVIPLRGGGGTRLKAIESLAAGLPIASTEFGVEGLGLIPDQDYLRAETAHEFAHQIRQITSDPDLAERLSVNGQGIARNRFSSEALTLRLQDLIAP
jgi:glycosyltransferase involved in cell wall biosynthesis